LASSLLLPLLPLLFKVSFYLDSHRLYVRGYIIVVVVTLLLLLLTLLILLLLILLLISLRIRT